MLRSQSSKGLVECVSHALQWLMPGWSGLTGSQVSLTALYCLGMIRAPWELQGISRPQTLHW